MLVSPDAPTTDAERRDVQAAAQTVGQQLIVVDVSSERDIETAFATIGQRAASALLVGAGAFLNSSRERLAPRAARHALPTIYVQREAVVAGGLMKLRTPTNAYRQAGIYAAGIFSRARSRPTYRWCNPPNSSSCSTSRPPRRSASKFRTDCSRSPTRRSVNRSMSAFDPKRTSG